MGALKRFLSYLLLLLLLAIARSGVAQAASKPQLSTHDKATIIQLALELKLKSQGPLEFSKHLVFSSREMSPALLPKLPGFKFRLMKPAVIKRRDQRREVVKYLDIAFSQKGQVVGFDLFIIERRGGLPMYSHVYKYVFSKSGDEWQGKIVIIIC